MATPPIASAGEPHVALVPVPHDPTQDYVEITNAAQVQSVRIDLLCDGALVAQQTLAPGTPALWRSAPLARCPAGTERTIAPHITVRRAEDALVERAGTLPLVVNESKPHYYSVRTREQGEADLMQLVRAAAVEEHFRLYVGTATKQSPQAPVLHLWCETGEEQTAQQVRFQLGAPELAFASTYMSPQQMSAYHFHPVCTADRVGCEYPSVGDIQSLWENAKEVAQTAPQLRFDYRVGTVLGMFILEATPQFALAREAALAQTLEEYAVLFAETAARDADARARGVVRAPDEAGRVFAGRVVSPFFRMTFAPLVESAK